MARTCRRRKPNSDSTYPWLMASTAYVNYYYYFYVVDEDFGPLFIKFCSYFPFNAKLCLNGHEYLKRQLARCGIDFEALDNGILSCADPERMQRLSHGLTAARIDALLRKWPGRLPHPFSSADRDAGLLYQVSILQAEFSLTQVLDRPLLAIAVPSVTDRRNMTTVRFGVGVGRGGIDADGALPLRAPCAHRAGLGVGDVFPVCRICRHFTWHLAMPCARLAAEAVRDPLPPAGLPPAVHHEVSLPFTSAP